MGFICDTHKCCISFQIPLWHHGGFQISFGVPSGPAKCCGACSWITFCTLFFGEPHSYCFSSPWLDGFRIPPLSLLPFSPPHLLTANPCISPQRRGCSPCFTLGLQTLYRVKSCSLREQQGESGMGAWARGQPPKWVSR